jgi:hypothetical protein
LSSEPLRAVALARQYTNEAPGNPQAWYLYGAALQQTGGASKAAFQRCAELAAPDSNLATECSSLAH